MNHTQNTRDILLCHYKAYPEMQLCDIFKFIHQSSFGCEHSVSSYESASERIKEEYKNVCPQNMPLVEKLDGNYCRVHLSVLNGGMDAETLARLFFMSAKKEKAGESALKEKLSCLRCLIDEKLLPFGKEEFERESCRWESENFAALHHSERFRTAYKPAYRVISSEYVPFLPLFERLDISLKKGCVKLCVDGGSASGKSTLGKYLEEIYGCALFHMDDFFLRTEQRTLERYYEVGGNVDRERFLEEVLLPLSAGKEVNYRRFDCSTMTVLDGVRVKPEKLNVIEGAYSMHKELEGYYDLSVFLDVDKTTQKERILKRNSPEMAKRFFEEWIPLEEKYFSETDIKNRCGMCIVIK